MYFPKWPLQRLCCERPELRDKPVAIIGQGTAARGSQILLVSMLANRSGIRTDMPVAEAMAIQPQLSTVEEDPDRDRSALQQLAEWAGRYSPIVGLEEGPAPESLLLDVTGCANCFHGEDRLADRATREPHVFFPHREGKARGWKARVAIAGSVGAAWALAHYGNTPYVVQPADTEKVLSGLPVAALRLPAAEIEALGKLGIEQIGALASLPRAGIATRFGPIVLQRLDQAMGRSAEVITPQLSLLDPEACYSFDYPTDRIELVNQALEPLIEKIHSILESRNQGARQVECWLYHEIAESTRIEVSLYRPSRSASHIGSLLRIRLEQLRLDEPVSALRLRVPLAELLSDSQTEFLDTQNWRDERTLSALIDRLSSRLGVEAVNRPLLIPDPQPEYACRFHPMTQVQTPARKATAESEKARTRAKTSPEFESSRLLYRPLRLWSSPQPVHAVSLVPDGPPLRFNWQGEEYRVVHTWGPERIETGWWRGCDIHRDYFVVATHLGTRFWLFRRHEDGRWFLHGSFD
jgi:protein ImuB